MKWGRCHDRFPPTPRRWPHRPRQASHRALRWQAAARLRRRHAGFGPSCQQQGAGRPQLQISPAAWDFFGWHRGAERPVHAWRRRPHRTQYSRHHDRPRRWPRGAFTECLAFPRIRCDGGQFVDRPAVPVGFLLQDLHGPIQRLVDVLRAFHPQGRGPWQGHLRNRSRPLRGAPRILRRSGRGLRPSRSRGGFDGGPQRRPRCSRGTGLGIRWQSSFGQGCGQRRMARRRRGGAANAEQRHPARPRHGSGII